MSRRPPRHVRTSPPSSSRSWLPRLAAPAAAVLVVLLAVAWWAPQLSRDRGPNLTGQADGRSGRQRPDLLLVTIDTLRADRVGCYGRGDAQTPVMDGLAARGVRFAQSVAHVPLTLPSHASILTGQTPLRHGVRDNAGFVLQESAGTLAGWLGAAGYQAAAFVSAFPVHSRFGLGQGFTLYDDRFPRGDDAARPAYIERRADATVGAAVAWLRAEPAAGRPVFAWVHLFDPHAPYEPPEPFASRFAGREYDGEVAFADQQIGQLIEAWAAARGREPVVLITSDHGEGLGEHGEPTHGLFIYDSTIRVPLILAGPGIPAGQAPSTLARGIDVAPTLLDLAGVAAPASVEGRSLRPAWEGGGGRDEPAYIESLFGRLSFGWAPLHGWRAGSLMYIDAPRPELYDVGEDPAQLLNLAQQRGDEARRLGRIVRAATASAGPLSPGPVPGDTRERLRGLGYLDRGSVPSPSLRDPKDLAAVAVRIEKAIAIERSDPAAAARELRDVLAKDSNNPLARRHLAVALNAAGRHLEAVEQVRHLVAAGDTSEETGVFLGDSLRLAGRLPEALEVLEDTVRNGGGRSPDVFNAQGKVLAAMGRQADAGRAFGRARAVAPDDAEALTGLADAALAAGDLAGARSWLELLRARDPGDPGTALKLGVVLVRLGQVEAALPVLRFSAERQPHNVDAVVAYGGVLAKTGRSREAVTWFERAVAAGAASPIVWNGLAAARLESGDRAGAAAALEASLRARPDQPDIREMLRRLGG